MTDVVDDFHAAQDDFTIYLVTSWSKRYCHCVARTFPQLFTKSAHVVRQSANLMVEAVYLCGIADDVTERVQVVVELTLKICRSFHLFLDPQMSGGLHHYSPFLTFQFIFRLVGIEEYHS